MRTSKFQGLLEAAKEREPEEDVTKVAATLPAVEEAAPTPPAVKVERGPGRPAGKHSNPAFRQVSVYLSRDTHRKAKMALLAEGEDREFSELVEELVGGWLRTRSVE